MGDGGLTLAIPLSCRQGLARQLQIRHRTAYRVVTTPGWLRRNPGPPAMEYSLLSSTDFCLEVIEFRMMGTKGRSAAEMAHAARRPTGWYVRGRRSTERYEVTEDETADITVVVGRSSFLPH